MPAAGKGGGSKGEAVGRGRGSAGVALLPPAGRAASLQTRPHLLLWVLEGDHQHHVPSFELQLVRVSGRVVVLGLHLQRVGRADTPFLGSLCPTCSPVGAGRR